MNKKKRIENSEDLVNALEELFDQTLMDVPEEANTILKEAGYDPDAIGKRMEDIARRAMSNSPLNWKNRARQELEKERARLEATSSPLLRTRTEILAEIERLRSKLGGRNLANVFFRNFEQATDDDLAGILQELEYLASQNNEEG